MSACTRPSCGGSIAADGYCNTCGYAGSPAAPATPAPVAPSGIVAAPPPPAPPPPPQGLPVQSAPPLPTAAPTPPPLATGPLCAEVGCGGSIAADGYCNTCGIQPTAAPAAPAHGSHGGHAHVAAQRVPAGASCTEAGCSGTVASDGYCNICGMQPSVAPSPSQPSTTSTPSAQATIAAPMAPESSRRVMASGQPASARTRTTRTTSTRAELGAGLVRVAPTVAGDPTQAVMSADQIAAVLGEKPEDERFCSACGQPVGRGHGDEPGRVTGFCGNCRTKFDFQTNTPQLNAGDLVAGQYRILGPVAHGGMGWIYLGQDTAVSNRWVVLKGLLNEDDEDAVASAVAERQFLARIEHGSIVNIYNFVTWAGAGYIVMEYVGGESLNKKLKDRRRENNGSPNPLPITEAIAYVLGILPALGYLHEQNLVYNDLKPANIMAVGETVKLIDVGGVMQTNDQSAAIFGTQGFQAPEVASMGPSVASDLFTVGRTLAVMSLNFVFHTGTYQYELPGPADEPLFAHFESLYRFLLKATAAHPDDRFQDAGEMAEQLLGVLREIVAREYRTPRPTTSSLFGGDRLAGLLLLDDTDNFADWRTLPVPKVNPEDPAAAFLNDLPEVDPVATINLITSGLREGAVIDSVELRLRRAREMVDAGQNAEKMLESITHSDPWNWRVSWYRAVSHLRDGDAALAAEEFSAVWTELPGELSPKLATALSAESAGAFARAAQLYAEVIAVDQSYVSAAFGLARCRVAAGDRQGAVQAYDAVPTSSATYTDAQVALARVLTQFVENAPPTAEDLATASNTVEAARIDAAERGRLAIEVLERSLAGIHSGAITEDPKTKVFGHPLTEEGLRHSLEEGYRDMAKLVATEHERFAFVDKANAVRVPSFR